MLLDTLTAISPVDGRYRRTTAPLENYYSEFALIKYRVKVEVEYFIMLASLPLPQLQGIPNHTLEALREIYKNLTVEEAQEVKDFEAVTNHDVKAVEYFLKKKFDSLGLTNYKEFIHFGLTSQDINNTATPMALADSLNDVYYPLLNRVIERIEFYAQQWDDVPMLARTHGQPATPTRLGKEMRVFAYRLRQQLKLLRNVPVSGKFGGATGNMNAHKAAYPSLNWPEIANNFLINNLGIQREEFTTQISNYDNLAAIFDALARINTIIIDFDRDIWMYISMNYFRQKIKEGEVGSSAMPHKVNPIDFENSEGNLGMANAIFNHLASKLPISRMQRDLTDSTVLRNVGVPLAHTIIAFNSTLRGLDKLLLNANALANDLKGHWAVVAEAIQTVLRREGYPKPYEALKALTRTNEDITEASISNFIESLNISPEIKAELHRFSPESYLGF